MTEPQAPDEEAGDGLLPALVPQAGKLVCGELPLVRRALGDIEVIGERIEAEKLYEEARDLWGAGLTREALEKCLSALERAQGFTPARALAAACLARLDRRSEAVEYAERAEREAPTDVDVCYYVGKAFQKLGAVGEAESRFRRCLELDRGHFRAECALAAIAMTPSHWDEVAEHTDRLLEISPYCACGHMLRAVCELRRGNFPRVREAVETGLVLLPFMEIPHDILESRWPGESPPMARKIKRSGLHLGKSADVRRIRSHVRRGELEKAYALALSLDAPDSVMVLKADLLGSISARMAREAEDGAGSGAGDGAEMRSLAERARGHLDRAEELLPGYWLTARIRERRGCVP